MHRIALKLVRLLAPLFLGLLLAFPARAVKRDRPRMDGAGRSPISSRIVGATSMSSPSAARCSYASSKRSANPISEACSGR